MRAGPLSSPKIVNLLNTHFVNVWVLLRDLPKLQAGAKGAAAATLATKLRQHYTDSVDILTLTPKLEVIEHLPGVSLLRSDCLPRTERIPRYLELLKASASVAGEDLPEDTDETIEKTITALEARLQKQPDDESFFDIYPTLVGLYNEVGREKDIETLINRVKSIIKPDDLQAHFVLGATLERMKRYEAVATVFEKIEEHHPETRRLSRRIGEIHEALGNTELAMKYLSKVKPTLALIGKPVPDFSATDLDGKLISLQDYRGKVVLLDFWAAWNSFCIADILNVKKVYDTYKDHGFEVIGVSLDTDEAKLRNFLKENSIPWRQIFSGQECQSPLAQQYDVRSIPARWLIDRDGTLIAYEANHKLMSHKGREAGLEQLVAAAVNQ